jgi:hypothetical protein
MMSAGWGIRLVKRVWKVSVLSIPFVISVILRHVVYDYQNKDAEVMPDSVQVFAKYALEIGG